MQVRASSPAVGVVVAGVEDTMVESSISLDVPFHTEPDPFEQGDEHPLEHEQEREHLHDEYSAAADDELQTF